MTSQRRQPLGYNHGYLLITATSMKVVREFPLTQTNLGRVRNGLLRVVRYDRIASQQPDRPYELKVFEGPDGWIGEWDEVAEEKVSPFPPAEKVAR